MSEPTSPARGGARAFIASEARGYWRAFWRTGLVVTAVVSGVWTLIALGFSVSGNTPGAGVADVAVNVVVALVLGVLSLPWTLALGVCFGAARVLWRGAGVWAFVPFVAIPLGIVGALWLAVPLFASEAHMVREGARVAGSSFDLPVGGGHGGGAALLLLYVILLPLLLLQLLAFLLHPALLLPILLLLATTCAVALAGAFVAGVPTLGLAVRALVRRTRARWVALSTSTEA